MVDRKDVHTMSDKNQRLCIDCKWHYERKTRALDIVIINHDCLVKRSLVTGDTVPKPCEQMRDSNTLCGEYGHLWEAKP